MAGEHERTIEYGQEQSSVGTLNLGLALTSRNIVVVVNYL